MTNDQLGAGLLTECIAGLDKTSADRCAGIQNRLRQIEDVSPGEVEAMATRLQLHRLGLKTAQ